MTPDQPPYNDDNSPALTPTDTLAEQYLLDQVQKARVSLNKSRLFGMISLFAALAYMGYITLNLQQFLRPRPAAELASGIITERVNEEGPQIAEQVKQQIPMLIGQIPDYAQEQLPAYREGLENQFEATLTQNLTSSSQQLDKNLDGYLDDHKDEIKLALSSGQESAAVKQLGNEVSGEFMTSLKQTTVNGESIQRKLDNSLSALTEVRKKMDRLANAKDLTPRKRRHATRLRS